MPEFTTRTLALTDEVYDRRHASDGISSRFGAYLALNPGLLHDDGAPLTAKEFAFSVWQIATSPVMSPGYVRIRPDLHALTLVSAGYDGDVALRVDVPLRHRALAEWPATIVGDWQPDPWTTGSGDFTALMEPERTDRTALLITATVLVPVPSEVLITPTVAEPGREMTAQAKQAVGALVDHANAHAHLLGDLLAWSIR